MSYTQTFRRTIEVPYSGTEYISVDGKQVRVHYSGTAYEDVDINIEVNTNPFDSSVASCNGQIGVLTGSVVATEAAQVASIRANSRKVADTIVQGFFTTVQSEITQQIAELQSRIDADLIHLRELAKSCVDKQRQMEVDYNRTSAQYAKIFTDLNDELKNRIRELDRPMFEFKETSDKVSIYDSGTTIAGTTAVAGMEGSRLQAMLSASISKKRSNDTLQQINTFLLKQKEVDNILQQCILADCKDAAIYAPICYVKTENQAKTLETQVLQSTELPRINHQQIVDKLEAQDWQDMSEEAAENIRQFFGVEMSKHIQGNTPHTQRVQNYIAQLFNTNSIKTI